MVRIRPWPNAPALRVGSLVARGKATIVVSDLHLGLGATHERPLGPPEGSAPGIASDLLALCEEAGAGRLLIAGDIKHPIVGAPPWLRPVLFDFFSELLSHRLEVSVVLGNHDVGLARMLPREVEVIGADGAVRDGVGVFHGHRWPSDTVLAAPVLVAGHLHPGYRFAPSPSAPDGKRKCWVRVRFPDPPPAGRRARPHPIRSRELIVLPAFHPLAGTESLNRQRPTRGRSFLYKRFLSRGAPRAYLLDGADLGEIPTGPTVPERADARARPRC